MKLRSAVVRLSIPVFLIFTALMLAAASKSSTLTLKAYVIDSACAFTKGLAKPISPDCAVACAKAGSPLVLLSDDGTVYWPISDTTPASGQNEKLLPFAGEKVTASGKVFSRGGSRAIVIDKIDKLAASNWGPTDSTNLKVRSRHERSNQESSAAAGGVCTSASVARNEDPHH